MADLIPFMIGLMILAAVLRQDPRLKRILFLVWDLHSWKMVELKVS